MKFCVVDLLATHRTKTLLVRTRATKQPFLNLLLAIATGFFCKRGAQFLATKQLVFIQLSSFTLRGITRTFPPRIWASNGFLLLGTACTNHLNQQNSIAHTWGSWWKKCSGATDVKFPTTRAKRTICSHPSVKRQCQCANRHQPTFPGPGPPSPPPPPRRHLSAGGRHHINFQRVSSSCPPH